LQLFRDNTAIGKKIQAESSLVNENVPYCLNFIDNPTTPGTYTYSVRIVNGGAGGFGFGEADGNHITLLELGAWSAGTMPVSKGGTGNSSYTAGSVMFSDGTNIAQNNTQLFWDNTNRRLGIGNNAPSTNLDVTGSLGISGSAIFRAAGGDEGGEIEFGVPQTNTNLSTRVVTDIWQNRYRIFDGNSKGVYIDLNKAPAGVGGEITFKASGYVNAGSFVQLDNIKATVPTSGNRSLSLATVSGTFTSYVTGVYAQVGGGSAGTGSYVTVTTTPSLPISWNFGGAGDTVTYMINDTTNSKVYRIVLMIGPGYNNNFISIERLH
jgi:hypothetical protein